MEYFRNQGYIVLTGNVYFSREGRDSVKGDRIVYIIRDDHFIAESLTETQVETNVFVDLLNTYSFQKR